ncbi:GerAB/ArcD/ProY family transporter [Gorillibacterium massiliense]|uniref:GerAB/ArcD/ProY family transporter n=1 Tax=Gorillibacterium massiliense TaxID=1280390 RepID=UPI0004BB5A08|nr:endospore germination permease [Gorillibacterium massiliense]
MDKIKISQRQMAFILAAYLIAPTLINLPHYMVELGGSDSIFALLLSVFYLLGMAVFFVWLAKRHPGKNLYQINLILLGKWFGSLLNALILFQFWIILVRDIRQMSAFFQMALLPKTPTEIVILLFFLVLIYYGSTSVEVAVRVNELFFPVLMTTNLLFPLLLTNDMRLDMQDPLFVRSPLQVGAGSLLSASWFCDFIIAGVFLNLMGRNLQQIKAALRAGIMLALFMVSLVFAACVLVLGPSIVGKEIFPIYTMAYQIHLTDFMDRLDLVIFALFAPSYMINAVMTFTALMIGISSFSKTKAYAPFSRSFGLLMALTVVFSLKSYQEVEYFSAYGISAYALTIIFITFLSIWVSQKVRDMRKRIKEEKDSASLQQQAGPERNQGQAMEKGAAYRPDGNEGVALSQSEQPEDQSADEPAKQRKNSDSGKSENKSWSQKRWTTVTNWVLLLALAFIIVGFMTGKDFQPIARICGLFYAISITVALLSAYMEGKRAIAESKQHSEA